MHRTQALADSCGVAKLARELRPLSVHQLAISLIEPLNHPPRIHVGTPFSHVRDASRRARVTLVMKGSPVRVRPSA
jgi:hypothetical protein